jgi:hypothetical protein
MHLAGMMSRRLFALDVATAVARTDVLGLSAPGTLARFGQIVAMFGHGYSAALELDSVQELGCFLNGLEAEHRGFGFEGAAMALTLLDRWVPTRVCRLRSLLAGAGGPHRYMVHAGIGWGLARLPWPVMSYLMRFDPLCRWLIADGYGFHDGMFRWRQCRSGRQPRRLKRYALRAFDQGLGRCLWFRSAADPDRVVAHLAEFSPARQGDLWSGVGLAAAYAGGAQDSDLDVLVLRSGPYRTQVALGAAFAVAARAAAGNAAAHTDRACEHLTGATPAEVVAIVDAARERAAEDDGAYERWRRSVRFALD